MSVRPSVRMEQLGSYWTDFHEIWYLRGFLKSVDKSQVSLKSEKNSGTLHENHCTFIIIYRWILLRMMLQTRVVEKIKLHFMFIIFLRKSCRSWDNVENYCTAGQATDDNTAHKRCDLQAGWHISISYMHSAMGGGAMYQNQWRSVQ